MRPRTASNSSGERVGAVDDLVLVHAGVLAHRRQRRFELVVDAHQVLACGEARLADDCLQRHRNRLELSEPERDVIVGSRFDVETGRRRRIINLGDQRRGDDVAKTCLAATCRLRHRDALGQKDRGQRGEPEVAQGHADGGGIRIGNLLGLVGAQAISAGRERVSRRIAQHHREPRIEGGLSARRGDRRATPRPARGTRRRCAACSWRRRAAYARPVSRSAAIACRLRPSPRRRARDCLARFDARLPRGGGRSRCRPGRAHPASRHRACSDRSAGWSTTPEESCSAWS